MKGMLRTGLLIAFASVTVLRAYAAGGAEAPAATPAARPSGVVNPLGKDDPDQPMITMRIGAIDVDEAGFPAGMTRDRNVWTDLYREVLGVEMQNAWVVPQAQANERVNLQIAAGDIPDLLRVNMNQGNLYAIPYTSAIVNMTPVPWIRFDWLEKLGLEAPETTKELYEIVRAFVTQDPNGTGVADTAGLPMWAGNNISNLAFEGLMTSFNAYTNKWVKAADGSLEFSAVSSNARDALEYLRRAYADGLIPRDFGSWGDGQANEAIDAGRAGIFWWPWWAPYWMGASRDNDPTADWRPIYPPEGPNGTRRLSAGAVPEQFYAIRKGFPIRSSL